MQPTSQHTTMICLFHDPAQANAAVEDLVQLGFSKDSIGVMANSGSAAANPVALEKWKVPANDANLLINGINDGGVVVAVSATEQLADEVEDVFTRNQARKVDETDPSSEPVAAAALPTLNATGQFEVLEEEMVVGKRKVQLGGVRVYKKLVERPVAADVKLREERISVERRPVNRALTASDEQVFTDRTLEVTGVAEEATVSKIARVVEEVVISREATGRTEIVKDSVRRTDVEVEEIPPNVESSRS